MEKDISWIYAAKALWPELILQKPDTAQSAYTDKLTQACIKEGKEARLEDPRGVKSLLDAQDEDKRQHAAYLASHGLATRQQRDAWTVFHFAGLALPRQAAHYSELNLPIKLETYQKKYLPQAIDSGLLALQDAYWGMKSFSDEIKIVSDRFKTKAVEFLTSEIQTRLSQNLDFILLEKVVIKPSTPQEFTVSEIFDVPKP